jgi:hypothetical protein
MVNCDHLTHGFRDFIGLSHLLDPRLGSIGGQGRSSVFDTGLRSARYFFGTHWSRYVNSFASIRFFAPDVAVIAPSPFAITTLL